MLNRLGKKLGYGRWMHKRPLAPGQLNRFQKMQKDVRKLKARARGEEVQKYDASSNSTPDNSTGSVVHLSFIAEGDGENERTGQKINHLNTVVRGKITMHASATNTKVRILIIRQKTNATPQLSGVLQAATGSAAVDRFKSSIYGGLSTIMYDKTVQLHTYRPAVSFFAKAKSKFPIEWADGTAAGISKNHVYMILISDEATNTPTLDYTWRVNYYDK